MTSKDLSIATDDGTAAARLHLPEGGVQAAVILYMDAFGPRPALDQMAGRLVEQGYAVLVPDLFYRFAPYGPFDAKTAFGDEAARAQLMKMIGGTTQEMTLADSAAFLAALDAEGITGKVGTVGYCMGGGRAMRAAAAHPGRIAAAASLHGGNLAADDPQSPHRNLEGATARFYVGCAGVDQSFPPEQSAALAQALRAAGVDHMIENYVGCEHGWCVPDSRVHNPEGAERHWRRLTELFAETL